MKCLFLVLLLLVCVVKCEENNYYVIRAPDDEPRLKVYWNVPTMQCASKNIPFTDLHHKYGIYQNNNDRFRGEKVTIMYDPGLFPALLKNETSGKFKFRNGGVPQEGDLEKHLEAFKKDLDMSIPDRGFDGIGIIDFESWRPIFRQNFGVLQPYKDVSYEIERKLHWWWQKQWIEAEAKKRFESSARLFMQATIELARELRPKGLWGFYGFPYCFNMASNNMVERCATQVPEENDRISWLWRSSTALYPSVYSSSSLSTSQLSSLIRGRVKEARREGGLSVPVLPYFWYRYRDAGFLTKTDINAALQTFYKSNASGFIIWGSSSDVNTADKCKRLLEYVERVLGPAVAKYTKTRRNDEIDESFDDLTTEISIDNNDSSISEHTNNATDIKKQIEEEIRKKFTNYAPINEDNTNEEETAVLNNSVLVDLIINSMINNEISSFNNNVSTTEGFQLADATTESSLNEDKANITTVTNIYDSNFKNEMVVQSTTEYYMSTTESEITDKTIENKETTLLDAISSTTEYYFENDPIINSSTIESDIVFMPTDNTTEFDLNYTDSSTMNTNFVELTTDSDNLNAMDDFFNLDTFDLVTTVETTEFYINIDDKQNKKVLHNEVNYENTFKTPFTEIHSSYDEFTSENNNQDITMEPLHSTTYIYNLGTTTTNDPPENVIKTESPEIGKDNSNSTDNSQEIQITATESANFDESTVNSTTTDDRSLIENSTAVTPTEDKVVVYVL